MADQMCTCEGLAARPSRVPGITVGRHMPVG